VYNDNSPWIVVEYGEHNKGKIPWAIKEGQNDYKIRFNMPGMNKKDVKVWIEENMLVVKAEKVATEKHQGQANGSGELSPEEDEDWPANSYGRYNHRISLPENIEFEKIKAQVKDGVLYVTKMPEITLLNCSKELIAHVRMSLMWYLSRSPWKTMTH
jgi:HSP20 family protein